MYFSMFTSLHSLNLLLQVQIIFHFKKLIHFLKACKNILPQSKAKLGYLLMYCSFLPRVNLKKILCVDLNTHIVINFQLQRIVLLGTLDLKCLKLHSFVI